MKIVLDLDKLIALGVVEVIGNPGDVDFGGPTLPIKTSEAEQLLNFLNEKAGRNYQPVPANIRMIKARLKEYSKDQLQMMIARQCAQWKGTDREEFLRPATLFNATKCAQYIGSLVK